MEYLFWSIAILLILTGLVGSFVPLLPGTTLILAGTLFQKWLLPETLGWTAVGWIIGFWVLSVLADLGCALLGTKWFGGGKWGMAGASGGALAGMFFSLPAFVRGAVLGLEAGEGVAQEGEGPLAVEVGGRVGRRGELALVLGRERFPRDGGMAAAAFFRGAFLPLVAEEEAAALAEVAPETALLGVGGGEEILLQQVGEKGLGEVLGRFGAIAQAADENIHRPPVDAA